MSQEIVVLDVGGTLFKTTKSTLIKSPYFDALFNFESGSNEEEDQFKVFLDRNPKYFSYVLDFLRGYPVNTGDDEPLKQSVSTEFSFFDLPFPQEDMLTEDDETVVYFTFHNEEVDRLSYSDRSNSFGGYGMSPKFSFTKTELERCPAGPFYDALKGGKSGYDAIKVPTFLEAHKGQLTPRIVFKSVVNVLKFGEDGIFCAGNELNSLFNSHRGDPWDRGLFDAMIDWSKGMGLTTVCKALLKYRKCFTQTNHVNVYRE